MLERDGYLRPAKWEAVGWPEHKYCRLTGIKDRNDRIEDGDANEFMDVVRHVAPDELLPAHDTIRRGDYGYLRPGTAHARQTAGIDAPATDVTHVRHRGTRDIAVVRSGPAVTSPCLTGFPGSEFVSC